MDEGESDAGADLLRVAFGLEERFEDVLESLGRYAHAVVADHEAELVVGGAGGLHVDASEAVGELDAVGDEVVENLTHVVGHEVHGDHVLVGGVDELDALLLCVGSEGLHAHADERYDVALLPVGIADGGLDFRDVEQLVDECEQLVALPADDGGVVDQFFACHGGVADDVVGDAEDDGERCAELVGDVGEEPLAAGLQLAHELTLTASRPDVDAHAAEEECGDDEECAEEGEGEDLQRALLPCVVACELQLVADALSLDLDAHVLHLVENLRVVDAVVVGIGELIVLEGLGGAPLAFVDGVVEVVDLCEVFFRRDVGGLAQGGVEIPQSAVGVTFTDVDVGERQARLEPVPHVVVCLEQVVGGEVFVDCPGVLLLLLVEVAHVVVAERHAEGAAGGLVLLVGLLVVDEGGVVLSDVLEHCSDVGEVDGLPEVAAEALLHR